MNEKTAFRLSRGVAAGLLLALSAMVGGLLFWGGNNDKRAFRINNFSLLDASGRLHELYYHSDAATVTILAHAEKCSWISESILNVANFSGSAEIAGGNRYFLLNAEPGVTRKDLAAWSAKHETKMPILKDDIQWVSKQLGLEKCGDGVMIDPKSWTLLKRGTLADFFPGARIPSARESIPWEKMPARISFSKDVAPILIQKCLPCHRANGIAPWAMDGQERVRGWAPMIQEVVLTKRMPPWAHDAEWSEPIKNPWSLSAPEKKLLVQWAAREANEPAETFLGPDPLKEASTKFAGSGPWEKPDYVLTLPEKSLPSTGTLEWTEVEFPLDFGEDKWVRAAQIVPSNPQVLHHVFFFVDYPKSAKHLQPAWRHSRGLDGSNGFFASFGPGVLRGMTGTFPENTGKLIPKGATGRLQIHYVTTGRKETNTLRMEIFFHKKRPRKEFKIMASELHTFVIPPGQKEYPYQSEIQVNKPIRIFDFCPHMHFRGKWMEYYLQEANESAPRLLFSLPKYNTNWQGCYRLATPIEVQAPAKILIRGAFDNSAQNPLNPDPRATVRFGQLSTDEMFTPYVGYTD